MRKITFALINFNNKNLNAFDTKQEREGDIEEGGEGEGEHVDNKVN